MYITFLFLLLLGVSFASQAATGEPQVTPQITEDPVDPHHAMSVESPTLAITISPTKQHFAAREDVTLNVYVRNVSQKEVVIASTSRNYNAFINDSQGHTPLKTEWLQQEEMASFGNALDYTTLLPSKIYTFEMDVSFFFQLKAPGTYTMYIEGSDFPSRLDYLVPTVVKSNAITVTVDP